MIDPRAVISNDAILHEDVSVGPYCVIGDGVEIAAGTKLGPHVVINGPTRIGRNNRIYQFSSLGEDPQDKKFHGEHASALEIGDGNVIREFCTINRGTESGGGRTIVGDNNWIMAYVHIAHDCYVGSHTIFANNVNLGGHVVIEDHVILGGFVGVHQFCRVGAYSFAAIAAVIVKDVPPYLMVTGNAAKPKGLNFEGLKRANFSKQCVTAIKQAYRIVYRNKLPLKDAMLALQPLGKTYQEVQRFADFISASTRSIVR